MIDAESLANAFLAFERIPRLLDRLERRVCRKTATEFDREVGGIHPQYLYSPEQAARILGIKSIKDIGRPLLPRTTRPKGRVRGCYLLAYQGLISYEIAHRIERGLSIQASHYY